MASVMDTWQKSNCNDLKKLFYNIRDQVDEFCKNAPFFFHYVFHDSSHYKNMYEYLDSIRNRYMLVYSELFLLRIAIYLHDIGMFLNPRRWSELKVSKDDLLLSDENLMEKLKKNVLVDSFLKEKIKMSFEDAFFNEDGCLRLPPKLKDKSWDEFDLIEKAAIREVMRKLHPLLGGRIIEQMFLSGCEKISESVRKMVELHEGKSVKRIEDLSTCIKINDSCVDLKKLTTLLILLDSLDCVGKNRASPETLRNIIDEIRKLEDKVIELETKSNNEDHGYLAHWIFKNHIEKINVRSSRITIFTDTLNPSPLAGILFFEINNNLWRKFDSVRRVLEEYGLYFDIIVQTPDQKTIFIERELSSFGKKFCSIPIDISELPSGLRERYKSGRFTLIRALALLLSYGGAYNDYADHLARKHICRLLAELGSEQRSQLEQIFRCS
ncbi:MAG: hypothetical protein QXX41_14935 [Nitrososphaerota archaeon]